MGFVRDLEVVFSKAPEGQVPVVLTSILRRDREGLVTGYEGIVKDITERKGREARILREKKTTEGILEGLPMPTFVIDRHHRITYWNRACGKLTGQPREEMVGSYRYWLPFYSHEGPPMASLVVGPNFKPWKPFSAPKISSAPPICRWPSRPTSISLISGARALFLQYLLPYL